MLDRGGIGREENYTVCLDYDDLSRKNQRQGRFGKLATHPKKFYQEDRAET